MLSYVVSSHLISSRPTSTQFAVAATNQNEARRAVRNWLRPWRNGSLFLVTLNTLKTENTGTPVSMHLVIHRVFSEQIGVLQLILRSWDSGGVRRIVVSVCLIVCLSVCATLCTSGFSDDVTFDIMALWRVVCIPQRR